MSKPKKPLGDGAEPEQPEWLPPASEAEAMARALDSLMLFLLHALPTKPADPAAWEHLIEADMMRRHLHEQAGTQAADLIDPHGREVNPTTKED